LLEDFTALIDEINDNLDQYAGRPLNKDDEKDFHKGLKDVMTAEQRFRARLRTLRHEIETDPQTRTESKNYAFVLQDAEDALKSSLAIAQEYSKDKDEAGEKKK
jgi:hypothetical protein